MDGIDHFGDHSAACHTRMYVMGAVLRHGSVAQKCVSRPEIASGRLRLQAFSITEDAGGSDTTSIEAAAVSDSDDFIITGHRSWTTRIDESDLVLVLTRTSPTGAERTRGADHVPGGPAPGARGAPETLEGIKIRTMFNYATN